MLSSIKMLGRRATPEERYSNQDTLASKLGHRGAWRALEDGLLLGAVLRFLPCRVDVDPVPCDEGREGVVAAHGRSWLARSWRETMPRFQPGVEGISIVDDDLTPTAARRARRRARWRASGRSRSTSPASPRRPGRPRAPAPCWAGSGERRRRPGRPRPRRPPPRRRA